MISFFHEGSKTSSFISVFESELDIEFYYEESESEITWRWGCIEFGIVSLALVIIVLQCHRIWVAIEAEAGIISVVISFPDLGTQTTIKRTCQNWLSGWTSCCRRWWFGFSLVRVWIKGSMLYGPSSPNNKISNYMFKCAAEWVARLIKSFGRLNNDWIGVRNENFIMESILLATWVLCKLAHLVISLRGWGRNTSVRDVVRVCVFAIYKNGPYFFILTITI